MGVSGDWAYRCAVCHRTGPADIGVFRCPACGGPLDAVGGPPPQPAAPRGRPANLWRYAEALPVTNPPPEGILGEGFTPLVPATVGGTPMTAKLEYIFPSGSFKDRGNAVMGWALAQTAIREVVEDSSGNAAASLAMYGARLGVAVTLFVPAGTSPGKVAQMELAGARVVAVAGGRAAAAAAAVAAVHRGAYWASHTYHPLFVAGCRTFAYEVAEQLGWRLPADVVVPVGNGTLLVGAALGFADLARVLGTAPPRLWAVQSAACAPLAAAWCGRPPAAPGGTAAEGIAIAAPPRLAQMMDVVRASAGGVVAVQDEDVTAARSELGRQGLLVEPTGAVAAAGAARLAALGRLGVEPPVVALTGAATKGAGLPVATP